MRKTMPLTGNLKIVLWISLELLIWVTVLCGFAWAFGAIWFLDYLPEWLRKALAMVYALFGLGLIAKATVFTPPFFKGRLGGFLKREMTSVSRDVRGAGVRQGGEVGFEKKLGRNSLGRNAIGTNPLGRNPPSPPLKKGGTDAAPLKKGGTDAAPLKKGGTDAAPLKKGGTDAAPLKKGGTDSAALPEQGSVAMGVKNVGTNWWPRAILAASILAVYLLTLPIQPTNDRDWDKDQLVLPLVNISGDGKIVIDNFRNFHYQTETKYDVNFQRKTFQLEDIHSVWYLIQRFTKYDGFAHTLVCFGLKNSIGEEDYFSISVEIRREEGELYSPIKGMYRQYELMYVVGDERDLVGVRTNVREDDRIFLYRINANPRQAQGLFLNYSDKINKLRRQPEFYHTLLNNCTNNIVKHTYPLTPQPLNPFDWQIVIPGYSAMVAYRQGLIGDGRESFTALQKRSRIDERARAAGITPSFSRDIRQGL